MTREEWCEVRGDADRAHAGAAAAVRDAESFVEIEMADVGADVAGRGEADLRVHVRAVHVNLAATRVDRGADVLDRTLEHAVRARIGDHERGEIVRVRGSLRAEIGDVDVAVRVARDGHDLEAAHRGARGIRAVRAGGDETDVAVALAARFVKCADDEEPGVFALRAGVGLERHGGEARDFAEPGFEVAKSFW